MRSNAIVIGRIVFQNPAQMFLAQDTMMWSKHSRRIDPISRSAKPFCHGEAGAVGLSRMPMARNRRVTTALPQALTQPAPLTNLVAPSARSAAQGSVRAARLERAPAG